MYTAPLRQGLTGIDGMECDVSLKGYLTVVSVTDSGEYVAELEEDLFSPNIGYSLFSPNAEFDRGSCGIASVDRTVS